MKTAKGKLLVKYFNFQCYGKAVSKQTQQLPTHVGSSVQTDATTPNNVGTFSESWKGYNP